MSPNKLIGDETLNLGQQSINISEDDENNTKKDK